MSHEITITVYTYNELSDDAKQRARDWYRRISEFDEWWESTYEDAKATGIKITNFDLNYRTISGEFISYAEETKDNILANHGNSCPTWKTANAAKFPIGDDNIDDYTDEYYRIANEFLHDILEDYLVMLHKEWKYLRSNECVEENIRCNEYEFTADGEIA